MIKTVIIFLCIINIIFLIILKANDTPRKLSITIEMLISLEMITAIIAVLYLIQYTY